MCGKLVLIVGPSGVGKDSILETSKEYFADNDSVIFTKRYITRPEGAGGENHTSLTEAEFEVKRQNGDFALSWRAHGFSYGISKSTIRDVTNGGIVVSNVSRTVIEDAKRLYGFVSVAYITAEPETLRQRLSMRGRETGAEIERRIQRAQAYALKGSDITTISNDGSLEEATQSFVRLISEPALSVA